jgi:nucleotide-binding universal stress UspA family protein
MKKNVLVPLDGSMFSQQIVPYICHVLDPEAYHLILLQVAEQPAGVFGTPPRQSTVAWTLPEYATARDVELAHHPIYVDQMEQTACAELEDALWVDQQALEAAGYSVSVAVRFGDPVQEIVAFTRDAHIDLVAMATHGRTGLSHLVMGSVAEQVLRRLTIPVMLVRPFAEEP